MAIESLRALMEAGENQDLCDIIIHSDCVDRGVTKEASFEKMRALYAAIRRARAGYDPALRSASGMGGGDAQAVCHAAAIAIKSMLGLVCDPIAGLVEVPCVKRNAAGAMIAMSSADMALAGIRSAVPPDEVILAMREVGDKMDVSLKETGIGGVAGTPFGQKIAEKMEMG